MSGSRQLRRNRRSFTYNCAVRGAPRYVKTGRHVGAPDGFDLLDFPEGRMREQLVKVADDLVEQLETFEALLVEIVLGVETLCKAGAR